MKQIRKDARKIPVLAETDVLVVGGGPGGLAASLAAAREGARTISIKDKVNCSQVNIVSLQRALLKQGVRIFE